MAYIPKYFNFQQERKIGEHTIYLPDPPNIRQIANRDKLEHKQVFKRTELPKDYYSIKDKNIRFERYYESFIKSEIEKRFKGYWFFNNGNLEYITGSYYFYLNWWWLNNKYPDFRDCDRDFFYLWNHVCSLKQCLGLLYLANRREGKTYKAGCILYDRTSSADEKEGTIQSKTEADAKKVYRKIINSWKRLPDFFRPQCDGDVAKELRFSKKSTSSDYDEEYPLDSYFDYMDSGIYAVDGRELYTYIVDEFGKTPKVDVCDRHDVAKECLAVGSQVVGKALYISTIEEFDKGGGKKAFELYNSSALSTLDSFGRTSSGLIRYLKPAYYGLNGEHPITNEPFVDAYGYSNIELAKSYLDAKRANLTGSALSSERRKFAYTEEDAFQVVFGGFYDGALLEEAKIVAEEEQESVIRRVTFYETKEGLIDIKDDENGFWWICWDFKNKSESNRVEYDYRSGTIKPLNNMKFSMGYDPAGNDGDIKGGSTPAALVKMEYDDKYEDFFNTYICLYYGRRRTWKEMDRDIEYMCRYYGCKVQIEKDQPLANNRMTENIRTRGFVANAGINSVDLSKSRGAITKEAISKMKEFGVRSGSAYALAQAKSLSQEYVIENYTKLKIPMMIDDLLKYDDNKRTNYDICCAFQWCEFESDNKYKLAKKTNKTNTPIKSHVYAPIISTKKYF